MGLRMLRRGGIDDCGHERDAVCREPAETGMLLNQHLTRSAIDAIDPVPGYEALLPLDVEAKLAQGAARGLRDRLELIRSEFSRTWNITFNNVLGHIVLLVEMKRGS